MSPRVRLERVEPGSYNVKGSDVFILAGFKDWAIHRERETGCIARLPKLRDCREFLNANPELWAGRGQPQ